MFQVLKAGIAYVVIAVFSAALVEGQKPVDPPLAPVPEQLLSANAPKGALSRFRGRCFIVKLLLRYPPIPRSSFR